MGEGICSLCSRFEPQLVLYRSVGISHLRWFALLTVGIIEGFVRFAHGWNHIRHLRWFSLLTIWNHQRHITLALKLSPAAETFGEELSEGARSHKVCFPAEREMLIGTKIQGAPQVKVLWKLLQFSLLLEL